MPLGLRPGYPLMSSSGVGRRGHRWDLGVVAVDPTAEHDPGLGERLEMLQVWVSRCGGATGSGRTHTLREPKLALISRF